MGEQGKGGGHCEGDGAGGGVGGAAGGVSGRAVTPVVGHDSVEDAKAALDLALLKIRHGE